MNVSDLMTQDLQRCRPDETLHRAAQLMYERDCGSVLVVGRDGHVHGIVTDRDACVAAYRTERKLSDIKLSEVMSENVEVCTADTSAHEAERMMRMLHVRRLPVADEHGTLVGVVTLADLVGAALASDETGTRESSVPPPQPRAAG
jgi:CBS domain-containing protein